MNKEKYNLNTARSKVQLQQMKNLIDRDICAFCPENIEKEQREPIELSTDFWIVKKNDYPYDNASLHLLLISKNHVKTFADLTKQAQANFAYTISEVEKKWGLNSYALGMRSGNFKFNGGSVEHLHAHIVVGSVDEPDHTPIRFKMSSKFE